MSVLVFSRKGYLTERRNGLQAKQNRRTPQEYFNELNMNIEHASYSMSAIVNSLYEY